MNSIYLGAERRVNEVESSQVFLKPKTQRKMDINKMNDLLHK